MSQFSYDGFRLGYSLLAVRSELNFVERSLVMPDGWTTRYKHRWWMPLLKSNVEEVSSNMAEIRLGLSDLRASCSGFGGAVADDAFLAAVAVLYHEVRHVEHKQLLRSSRDPRLRDMAVSLVAIDGNYDFYDTGHALFNFEADANESCLYSVRDYLYERFPDVARDRLDGLLVRAYVDGALLDDVTNLMLEESLAKLKSFDDVCINCHSMLGYSKTKRKQFAFDKNGNPVFRYGRMSREESIEALAMSLDEFAIAIGRPDTGYDWSPVLDRYLAEDMGSGVDKMLACVHLYLYPEARREMPILYDIDLSPEHVFGVPFPEPGSCIIRRINDLGGGINQKKYRMAAIGQEAEPLTNFGRNTLDLDCAFEEIVSREPSLGLDCEI